MAADHAFYSASQKRTRQPGLACPGWVVSDDHFSDAFGQGALLEALLMLVETLTRLSNYPALHLVLQICIVQRAAASEED